MFLSSMLSDGVDEQGSAVTHRLYISFEERFSNGCSDQKRKVFLDVDCGNANSNDERVVADSFLNLSSNEVGNTNTNADDGYDNNDTSQDYSTGSADLDDSDVQVEGMFLRQKKVSGVRLH